VEVAVAALLGVIANHTQAAAVELVAV